MSPRVSSFLLALGLLLVSGVMYHLLATDSQQLDEAVTRVALAPMVVGPWQAREETPDKDAFAQAGAQGYWMRTYTHQQTKATVLAILMCGRAGRMAVHTPEVCYRGAGYELGGDATAAPIVGSQFWHAQFTKKAAGKTSSLRLYWAWNARGDWEAPSSPRWHFRGEPFLYKLYVSHEMPTDSAQKADVTAEFLKEFVPQLREALFPRS